MFSCSTRLRWGKRASINALGVGKLWSGRRSLFWARTCWERLPRSELLMTYCREQLSLPPHYLTRLSCPLPLKPSASYLSVLLFALSTASFLFFHLFFFSPLHLPAFLSAFPRSPSGGFEIVLCHIKETGGC